MLTQRYLTLILRFYFLYLKKIKHFTFRALARIFRQPKLQMMRCQAVASVCFKLEQEDRKSQRINPHRCTWREGCLDDTICDPHMTKQKKFTNHWSISVPIDIMYHNAEKSCRISLPLWFVLILGKSFLDFRRT